jgi:ABC-2 type transport system permease protein
MDRVRGQRYGQRQQHRGVSQILPLRHLNDGMLSVPARGTGLLRAPPQFGVLLGFAAVFTLLATRLLRWDDV